MSLSTISLAGLEKLIALSKKRDSLQAELATVEQQLSVALGGGSSAPVVAPKVRKVRGKSTKVKASPAPTEVAAPAVKSVPTVKAPKPAKKGKRGALKDSVLAALSAAGSKGVSVKDLSSSLGVKSQNLHVWFSTTGKGVKGLKKTGAGTWTYAA